MVKWLSAFILLWASVVQAAVPVTSAPLKQLVIYPERSAPAQVESLNDSRLSAQVSALIQSIPVRVGDRIEGGQLLVQLDCREYRARRDSQRSIRQQFKSQLKLAESQLERSLSLRQRNGISEEKVEQRETELNVLRAQAASQQEQLNEAQLQVERCRILAPYTGVVRERLASVGELAAPGTPLLVLQQLDEVEVVAEIRAGQLNPSPQQWLFVYQRQRYPLLLRRQLPLIDPQSRTQQLRLEFSAQQAPPGASGRLQWRDPTPHLPADLLLRRGGTLGVMLLDDDKARFAELPTAIEGQPVAVDLPEESRVIIEGRQALVDGDAVVESN